MTISKQIHLLLFIIFFFFPLLITSQPKPCYTSYCGTNNINVRFPFSLFPKQPESCGYTGFNLLCTEDQYTILELPYSGPFLIREIDYRNQRISLNDPDNCLAKRLLTFNTSMSPFSLFLPQNYTFVICPKEENVTSSFRSVHCLGNSTSSFFVTEMEKDNMIMPGSCKVFKTLSLPSSWFDTFTAFPGNDHHDMWLKWDSPDCRDCERRTNSRCGLINNTSLQVQCFSSVNSGNSDLI